MILPIGFSLNPYYAGRWFLLGEKLCIEEQTPEGLNPYYAGRWFLLSVHRMECAVLSKVLILIMLEGGFCSLSVVLVVIYS